MLTDGHWPPLATWWSFDGELTASQWLIDGWLTNAKMTALLMFTVCGLVDGQLTAK